MQTNSSWALGRLVAVAAVATAGALSLGGCPSAPTTPGRSRSPASVVADRQGFSLYRFDESRVPVTQRRTDPRIDPWPDRRRLTCDAGTPPDWPAVAYEQNQTPPGVDRMLLGYLERADGRRQLTINGCPVYRYRADPAPGQTTGDGAAGTWFSIKSTDLKSARPHHRLPLNRRSAVAKIRAATAT
jgi:predicted lipoprotein with Yx(FWY)xxD motif